MDVEVYELTKPLPDSVSFHAVSEIDGTNYIDSFVDYDKPIGTSMVALDSTYVSIRLNDDFCKKLYNLAHPDIKEEDYKNGFHGLYVRVKEGSGGGIMYSNFVYNPADYYASPVPLLWTYYSYEYDGRDSVPYPYLYYTSVYEKRMNVFRHDYKALNKNTDTMYLQGLCGVATKFTIDTDVINAWTKKGSNDEKHYAINRAQLIFPVVDATNWRELDKYAERLRFFSHPDSIGYERDAWLTTMDGSLDRSHMYYSLNVTHFFYDVMKGKRNGMYLTPYSTTSSANSAFLNNLSGTSKPRLVITYEEIKTR
jgi:hypothetical protein